MTALEATTTAQSPDMGSILNCIQDAASHGETNTSFGLLKQAQVIELKKLGYKVSRYPTDASDMNRVWWGGDGLHNCSLFQRIFYPEKYV